jgi:hypothetical protein
LQRWPKDLGSLRTCIFGSIHSNLRIDTIYLARIDVRPNLIESQLILNKKKQGEKTSDSNRKTNNVYGGEHFIAGDISDRDEEIISDHR